MNMDRTPFQEPPQGRDLDRMLAFLDDELPSLEAERLLADIGGAERARLLAMRQDARALRGLPAPAAPDELHEAIMAAAERVELLASPGQSRRADVIASIGAEDARSGARPWALGWRSMASAAAMVAMLAGAAWFVWPRTPIAPAAHEHARSVAAPVAFAPYAPVAAPFALVLEYDDFDDADAALRSAMEEAPGSVLCVCPSHCTTLVEGPPEMVEEGDSTAEFVPVAACTTHKISIPASELPRVLSTLVRSGNGTIQARRFGAERWNAPAMGNVELPVFIVPSGR